jgi:BMFP domain-containing protein YqiC|tara:strand:- start:3376 stop:3609 length:234 start_codon:yes stop_codon:yes gene_type:complete
MTAKDPLGALFEILKSQLPQASLLQVQEKVNQLFSQLELVPKKDFEAHRDVMETLKQQVQDLEQRLKTLEQSDAKSQ